MDPRLYRLVSNIKYAVDLNLIFWVIVLLVDIVYEHNNPMILFGLLLAIVLYWYARKADKLLRALKEEG